MPTRGADIRFSFPVTYEPFIFYTNPIGDAIDRYISSRRAVPASGCPVEPHFCDPSGGNAIYRVGGKTVSIKVSPQSWFGSRFDVNITVKGRGKTELVKGLEAELAEFMKQLGSPSCKPYLVNVIGD